MTEGARKRRNPGFVLRDVLLLLVCAHFHPRVNPAVFLFNLGHVEEGRFTVQYNNTAEPRCKEFTGGAVRTRGHARAH